MVNHDQKKVNVLITGFGPFGNVKHNPSWEIVSRLPSTLDTDIQLLTTDAPIQSAYHAILNTIPNLLNQHNPDIVIHVGLAESYSYYAIEQSAYREGYHEIPDTARQVFTRQENKKIFSKSPSQLITSLDLESVVALWQDGVKSLDMSKPKVVKAGKGQSGGNGKQKGVPIDVRLSDDVGNYTCGFIYYLSMLEMMKRGKDKRDVVFLHVLLLQGDEEIGVGVKVTEALIFALVEVWRIRNL